MNDLEFIAVAHGDVVQYPVDVAVFPLIYSILLHPLEFSVSLPGHNLEAVDKAVTMLVVV